MGFAFLLLALLLQSICVSSAPPYTVTQYVQLSAGYTVTYREAFTSVSRSTYEYTYTVTPTGTPTNAIRTFTDTTSLPQVTIVNIVLPAQLTSSTSYDYYAYTRSSRTSYASSVTTDYVVPVTYVPSANCSQKWTHVTNVPITLPPILQGVITPVGIATTTQEFLYFSWSLTSIKATLAATDIPSNLLSAASTRGIPYGLTSCAKPTTTCYTSARVSVDVPRVTSCSVAFNSEYDDDKISSYDSPSTSSGRRRTSYDSAWRRYVMIIIIVSVGWTVLWLFVGMVQSWQSFKGLMLGQRERRGTPYAWGFVSCWFWCFMGPTYKAKSEEEQEILKARWLELKSGEKLKLYLKWGMKWSYPDVLGTEPEIDKKAWRSRKFGL